jgi:hypothetical protein
VHMVTYSWAIWRCSIFFIVMSHFVKVIFVQLSHETGEVAMLEMFGEYRLGKAFILLRISAASPGQVLME